MIKIYHNPKCSKSREGLQILQDSGKEFEVVKYLDNPLSFQQLTALIGSIGLQPIELVRKNESIWKENYKGKDLSKADIVKAMVDNPKLIERPIVVTDYGAVIGRPSEKIKELLDKPKTDPHLVHPKNNEKE